MKKSQSFDIIVGGYDGTISSFHICIDPKKNPDEQIVFTQNFQINLTANSQINRITSHDNFFCYAANPNYYIYTYTDATPSENTGHKTNVTDIVCITRTETFMRDESKDTTKDEIECTYIFTCSEDGSWKYKKFQRKCIQIDECLEEKITITTSSINSIQVKFPYIFLANERGEIDIYGIIDGNFGRIKISELPIRSIALSKNEDRLIAACHDGNIFIIQINYRSNSSDEFLNIISSFKAHDNAILKCIISPDNNYFVTTSADSTAKLWNFNNYEQKCTLAEENQKEWVWDASFTEDSQYVITGGSDNYIRIWDINGVLVFKKDLTANAITALTVLNIKNDSADLEKYEAISNNQPVNSNNTLEKKEENQQHDTQLRNVNNTLPLESQGNINNSHEMDNQSDLNNLNITDKEFSNGPIRPLSQEDIYRANIARQNIEIESSGKYTFIPSELITNSNHEQIANGLGETTNKGTRVYVNNLSSIKAAINSHNHGSNDKICILNFADAYKPGGGYLNGRNSQEETICRQTLLYPTIKNSPMYELNSKDKKPENSDIMQYSQDVYVIRDDDYELIDKPFLINVISSSAVDNHEEYVPEANEIMEERIRKIIRLAAFKKNDVLILGAFGCGAFKNDTYQICQIFKKILIEEGMKDYFKNVIFPIITLGNTFKMYKDAFSTE